MALFWIGLVFFLCAACDFANSQSLLGTSVNILQVPTTASNQQLGRQMAMSYDSNVIIGGSLGQNSVFVFVRGAFGYTQVAILQPMTTFSFDPNQGFFGGVDTDFGGPAVSGNGDVIVVGYSGDRSSVPAGVYTSATVSRAQLATDNQKSDGSVYVFRRSSPGSNSWNLDAYIRDFGSACDVGNCSFGYTVAITADGTTIAANIRNGQSVGSVSTGMIIVYRYIFGQWNKIATLANPFVTQPEGGYAFGSYLSFSPSGSALFAGGGMQSTTFAAVYLNDFTTSIIVRNAGIPVLRGCISNDTNTLFMVSSDFITPNNLFVFKFNGTAYVLYQNVTVSKIARSLPWIACAADASTVFFGSWITPLQGSVFSAELSTSTLQYSLVDNQYSDPSALGAQFGYGVSLAYNGVVAVSAPFTSTRATPYVGTIFVYTPVPKTSAGTVTLGGLVTGSLNVSSTTTIVVNATTPLVVQGALVIDGGSSLSLVTGTSGTFTVITAGSITGSFSSITAQSSNPQEPCASVQSSVYTTTTLTVTVQLNSSCSSLSTGAIIGIAVGASVGGLLLVAGIIILSCYLKKRATMQSNQMIKHQEMNNLR